MDRQEIIDEVNMQLSRAFEGEDGKPADWIYMKSCRSVAVRIGRKGAEATWHLIKRNAIKEFISSQANNISGGVRVISATPRDIVGDWRPITELFNTVKYCFDLYDTIKEGQRRV